MKRLACVALLVGFFFSCSEPIPEFKVVRAVDVTIPHGPVPLSGTVLLPAEQGTYPALIFVQGRSYGGSDDFRHHARQFAAKGVVGLVFDGRGHGESGGDPDAVTAEDRYADVQAVLEYASRYPEIDSSRLALFGHSAGGWVAAEVARREPRVRGLILHSAPTVGLHEQQGQVVAASLRRSSDTFSEDQISAAQAYQERLVDYAMRGVTFDAIEAFMSKSADAAWAGRVDRPESEDDSELSFFRRQPYDPTDALSTLQIPILALYGAEDWIVDPDDNAKRLIELVAKAGNEPPQIHVFPGADHALEIEGVPPDGYWPTLFEWSKSTWADSEVTP